jgi:hemerythrin-like domain-containing protein
MLTSTYTLVALSVEQTAVRAALHALAEDLKALPNALALAPACAAALCVRLREVVDACHWRKLDKFLVPALRRSDAAIDRLLQDLEQLSVDAAQAVAAAQSCVAMGELEGHVEHGPFSRAVGACITALRRRIERETEELFPLARSVVGGEAWFAIANQMLAHDAYAKEKRSLSQAAARMQTYSAPIDPVRRHAMLSTAH